MPLGPNEDNYGPLEQVVLIATMDPQKRPMHRKKKKGQVIINFQEARAVSRAEVQFKDLTPIQQEEMKKAIAKEYQS